MFNGSQGSGGFLSGNPMAAIGLAMMATDPTSRGQIGQAVGQMIQMQEFQQNKALQEKQLQLEYQKYGLAKEAAAREAKKFQRAMDASNDYQKIIGTLPTPGKPAVTPGQDGTPLMLKPQDAVPGTAGTGLLGNQLTPDQARLMASPDFFNAGDTDAAYKLLAAQAAAEKFGAPTSAVNAQGQPTLVQIGDRGTIRPVQGYAPLPKTGNGSMSAGSFIDPTINPAAALQQQMPGGMAAAAQAQPQATVAPPLSTGPTTSLQPAVSPASTTAMAPANPQAGLMIKNPLMGPSRGGQGGTYVNPTTGQIISTDTNRQTAMDQAAIAAIQRVEPQIDEIIKNLPKFQNGLTNALVYGEGVLNKMGANFKLPSQKAYGLAQLNSAPEALLKALGLQSTDEALKMVRGIIEPQWYESEGGYKSRVLQALGQLRDFRDQAQNRLSHGMVVGQVGASQPAAQAQTSNLDQFAQEAIARGADPTAVKARLKQLRGY